MEGRLMAYMVLRHTGVRTIPLERTKSAAASRLGIFDQERLVGYWLCFCLFFAQRAPAREESDDDTASWMGRLLRLSRQTQWVSVSIVTYV